MLVLKGLVGLHVAAAAAKSFQSCPILCDPVDSSPPGSTVPGILQARTLEWVAISFSNAWKWKVKVKSLSHVQLSVTPWTAAYQAPPSMRFSRQEYWSGVPLPSPVGLHRTVQIQLLQHYWLGHRLGLPWYWMVCFGNNQRSFCHFWYCIQVLHFGLFLLIMRAIPFLLKDSCPQ